MMAHKINKPLHFQYVNSIKPTILRISCFAPFDKNWSRPHLSQKTGTRRWSTAPEWLKEIDAQQQGTKATQVPPDGPPEGRGITWHHLVVLVIPNGWPISGGSSTGWWSYSSSPLETL